MWCLWLMKFFTLQPLSPQMQCRQPITTLLLFAWQMFIWSPFLSFSSSDLYGYDTPCYFYVVISHSFPPCIQIVRRWFHSNIRTVTLWNRFSRMDVSQNTRILIASSQGSIVIYLPYLHHLHFLFLSLSFISDLIYYNYFNNNSVTWLTLQLYIGWVQHLKKTYL